MASDQNPDPNDKLETRPGEYLPLRLAAFPKDADEIPPYSLHGTKDQTTTAYLFQYRFDILGNPGIQTIHELQINSQKVTIYPPFRSRPVDPRFAECMPLVNVPHRPNAASPDSDWLPAPQLSLPIQDSAQRNDSLRIDCPKGLPYEFAADVASKLVGLIRYQTNQWWINRGGEHPRTQIRHWFHANKLGERLAGVGVFAFFYGKFGFERPLDDTIWNEVARHLAAGSRPRLSWEIFLDAIYFHAADDLRRSVLELAISNEILLSESLDGWAAEGRFDRARVDQILGGNNFLSHLTRVERLWGRSFQTEQPLEFEWVKAAWIARGKLAHGGVPLAHGGRTLTLKDMPSMFGSVLALRRWLESI